MKSIESFENSDRTHNRDNLGLSQEMDGCDMARGEERPAQKRKLQSL